MPACINSHWLWFTSLIVFLAALAMFIPSAFSATWVSIPVVTNYTGDDLSAGLWTDCNSTNYNCGNYNDGTVNFFNDIYKLVDRLAILCGY